MSNKIALAALVFVTAGCTLQPLKRPLTPEAIAKLPQPTVYMRVEQRGVGVEYFASDSSAAGAQYGLLGALITAGIDAAMNAGPLKIAENNAERMLTAYNLEQLRTEFRSHLDERLKTAAPFNGKAEIRVMDQSQKIMASAFNEPAVMAVQLTYSLSQDFRYLHVAGDAHLFDKSALPPPPSQSKGKSKSKTNSKGNAETGLAYRNHFDYYSDKLEPAPAKSQAEIDAQVEAIRAKYRTEKRPTPAQRSAMQKEIDEARKPMAAAASAEYLTQQWLANDATRLREKMREGTLEVVKLLARDFSDPTPIDPKAKLPAKTIVEESTERRLVRYNVHPFMGAMGSEPVNFVATPSNGIMYGSKDPAKSPESASK